MTDYALSKACPTCKTSDSIIISGPTISCKKCSFKTNYQCPICEEELDNSYFKEDSLGDYFKCPACEYDVHVKRIQHILNNSLAVSHNTRCEFCNGPTLHRHDSNIGNRCIFFPKCSGQAALFGAPKESLVFLDFETTGLEAHKDHLIEIGALKVDEEGFEHSFSILIKPPVPISAKITQITGITDEMVKDAQPIDKVIDSLFEFIGKSKIVAHNADFDIPWLIYNFRRFNLSLPSNEIICTLKWARKINETHCSLGALTRKYKIGHANAHRALADAAATKELYFIFEHGHRGTRTSYPISNYDSVIANFEKVTNLQSSSLF
jgi:DNA polymerase III epsilon subunit family exonuclease